MTKYEIRDTSEEEKGRLYRRGVWRGRMNYECRMCAFATTGAMKMAGHLKTVHGVGIGSAAAEDGAPVILIEESEVKGHD